MTRHGNRSIPVQAAAMLAVLVFTLIISACARPARAGSPDLARHTLDVDGVERSYLLDVPPSYKQGTATPLVLVLHGLGGSGAIVARQSGFAQLAVEEGFIIAFPNGEPLPGQRNLPGWRLGPDNEDTRFIERLLDALQAEFSIDRVYIAGHSNGGALAYRLACDLAERIDGIGVVAGFVAGPCEPARPVPVLHIHGTDDPTVPYAGGRGLFNLPFPSVDEAAVRWRTLNGCEGDPEVTTDPTFVYPVTFTRWTTCQNGATVALATITGGGHEWPGGLGDRARAGGTPPFPATPALWHFFQSHPPSTP